MKPKFVDGKWYIEVHTEELGDVLLLDKSGLPIPLEFNTEIEALNHIDYIKRRQR